MLSLLKIKNIALIDELALEFGDGLNLLTGETGSGKSIIVDSLGALGGECISNSLIKEGQKLAEIEGLFLLESKPSILEVLEESGIDVEDDGNIELIVRRTFSRGGRNRVFVNNQLVTQGFLKKIGSFLADIHGQGEHTSLFRPANHLEILDEYASVKAERKNVRKRFAEMLLVQQELDNLEEDEAQKLQLIDILKFQIEDIAKSGLSPDEEEGLEEEKKRQNNVEKLSTLSRESFELLYENEGAISSSLERVIQRITELSEFDSSFSEYRDGLENAQAVLEDLALTVRDYRGSLEFSPERLEEVENRLAEISRLKRKYGGTLESVLAHLEDSRQRLEAIETSEARKKELESKLGNLRVQYLEAAKVLTEKRKASAKKFEKEVENNLKAVALEKARFMVNIDSPGDQELRSMENTSRFSAKGIDAIEFYFSANPGESPKPLAKVASGGEASRLMLILKTTAKTNEKGKSAVFDEVDAGIGGRVAEAVGMKLRELSADQQVLCVTHQPQVAALANKHFLVEKEISDSQTKVSVFELNGDERIEEVARMLAGEEITDTARKHARELIDGPKQKRKATG